MVLFPCRGGFRITTQRTSVVNNSTKPTPTTYNGSLHTGIVMKHRTIPGSALACSLVGYTAAGFFLTFVSPWAVVFAVAFAITGAWLGAWAQVVALAGVRWWVRFVASAGVGASAVLLAGVGASAGSWAKVMAGTPTEASSRMIVVSGAICWFMFGAVARFVFGAVAWRVVGAVRSKFKATITVVAWMVSGAVIWFVFGAVAGRVALAVAEGKFVVVVVLVVWAIAWAGAWFVFEAVAGTFAGSVAWAIAGAAFGVMAAGVAWTFVGAGVVAGAGAVAVSKAGHELLKNFSKFHTFVILAITSLSGLGLGRLFSELLLLP
jgi:hypothetical protein